MKFSEAQELKDLVTFIPNKREPIHNWYYYKEGFSKQFIDLMIKKLDIKKNNVVLDPFCGVGTTQLACKQQGIRSVGFDVSPLCIFVAQVKTADYDIKELERYAEEVLAWKFVRPGHVTKNEWIRRAFSKYVLEDVTFYKNKIFEIRNEKIRDFLILALMDSAMSCSYVYKDGAFARIQKRNVPPLGKYFKYKLKKMLKDVKKADAPKVEAKVDIGDARNIPLADKSVDFIITSPPYLNKIEYTKIYKTEYALFFQEPETQIRSFVNEAEEGYFRDMKKCLEEMRRVCKGKIAIVIGGGCFEDHAVVVDQKIAKIAEEIGFNVDEIIVARNSWCTRARTVKVGQIRESIIILS